MFIAVMFIAILAVLWASTGINRWLPNRIPKQELGLVELFYRWLNTIAPFFLLYSLEIMQFHLVSIFIGLFFYGVAWWIKKLTWNCVYGEWLK